VVPAWLTRHREYPLRKLSAPIVIPREDKMPAVLLKRFENPDGVRTFAKGRFEIVRIGGLTIGRATYEPGWKWSEHVSPIAGTPPM